jgi:predicted RNase H-like HicB family nuclease
MRKTEKIAGFAVEAFPHVKATQVEWVVQFRDLPSVRATGASLPEARERLAIKWKKTAEAFKVAGLPVPKPIRPRGNKRILDTIRRLAERKWNPIF